MLLPAAHQRSSHASVESISAVQGSPAVQGSLVGRERGPGYGAFMQACSGTGKSCAKHAITGFRAHADPQIMGNRCQASASSPPPGAH